MRWGERGKGQPGQKEVGVEVEVEVEMGEAGENG